MSGIQGTMILVLVLLVALVFLGGLGYLFVLICKALRKYMRSADVRNEKEGVKRSLGEIIKAHRTRLQMTQEFVSESLGVSRQAVSKWENGITDPSTSNLIALAKLFQISPEEMLNQIHND